jgi:2'-5' RNA ligase
MRTFIAFDLDPESVNTIKVIQDNYRKTASGKITYTRPDQFHLTVFFLGELGEKGVGRISEILRNSELTRPLSLHFDQLDYFPSVKKPRVIVLKSEPEPYLSDFVRKMDQDLLKISFKRDKKWLPHITLGRIRDSFSAGEFGFNPFTAAIDSLTLYKSTLTPAGSIYEKLLEIKAPQ